MKKFLLMVSLICIFSISTPKDASAWLIMKISNMMEDITTGITQLGKKAQNMTDKISNMTVVQKIGKGFAETKKWVTENAKKIKEDVSGDIASYKKIYNDSQKIYKESIGDYQKIYSDIKEIQKEKKAIEMKISELQLSIEAEYEAQKSQLSGQINTYEQNMSNLQKLMKEDPKNVQSYEDEYKKWKTEKEALQQQINNLSTSMQQQVDSATSVYKDSLTTLTTKISQLEADLSKVAGLSEENVSDEDALSTTADLYFLKFDEELNPQRQDNIRRNRLRERRDSIIAAYNEGISQIPNLLSQSQDAEDLGYNSATFDTTAGAFGADAKLEIDNLKALSSYAHLLIQDIKRQTAIAMSELTFYKLQREQKNIAEFNLDDYVYTKGGK